MPLERTQRVVVGRIAAAHGVRGWVKIHSYTDPATNLFDYQPLEMRGGDGRGEAVAIDQWRPQGKGLVAHIVGCDDRDAAMLLGGRELVCDAARLPALGDREYYWAELEGLEVYVRQGEREQLLGAIDHLLSTGANDVMVVRPIEGSIDRRERLIPWMLDRYVLEVDRARGRVLVDWDPDF